MGCDIHCYPEYSRPPRTPEDKRYWSTFGHNMNPGRNYDVFGLIAGVRREDMQLFEPRGLPDDMGIWARMDDQLYISEEPGEGSVNLETARGWVLSGASVIIDDKWVTNPDHHTHTWLTPDEWEQVITHESLEYPADDEYFAMLAAMRELEKRGNQVRVLIWFDN